MTEESTTALPSHEQPRQIRIGESTCILRGFDPSWMTKGASGLYPTEKQPLENVDTPLSETPGETHAKTGTWSKFPTVTLHDGPESLLDTLFPVEFDPAPATGLAGQVPIIGAGALLLRGDNRESALLDLSKTLGVKLDTPDSGFALIRMNRIDRTESHKFARDGKLFFPHYSRLPEFGVSDAHLTASKALPKCCRGFAFDMETITVDGANKYLDTFTEFGTHFVSKVQWGDVLFQVLVMPSQKLKALKDQKINLSGRNALHFQQFTTPFNETTLRYGYVREYGPILSFSGSSTITHDIARGEFTRNFFSPDHPSIFSIYDNDFGVDIDTKYTDVAVAKAELAPLSPMLEYSKRQVMNRILKAALFHLFGDSVTPNFVDYSNGYPQNLYPTLSNSNSKGFLTTIVTPTVNVFQSTIDVGQVKFSAPAEAKTFTLSSLLAFAGTGTEPNFLLPGIDVLIAGLHAVFPGNQMIRMQCADLAGVHFAFKNFTGMLQVCNKDNTDRFTLIDGLKLISKHSPHGNGLSFNGDVRRTPSASELIRLKASLQMAYQVLSTRFSTFDNDGTNTGFYRQFLMEGFQWLTRAIPSDVTDDQLLAIRVQSADLLYRPRENILGSFVPLTLGADFDDLIQKLVSLVNHTEQQTQYYQHQLSARRTDELIMDVALKLNDNIIASGDVLTGYIDFVKDQQTKVLEQFNSMTSQMEKQKEQAHSALKAARGLADQQQIKVGYAVANFKTAGEKQKIAHGIQFGLDIATAVFSLGTSIALPSSSITAVKELGSVAQKIQKFLNISQALSKVYAGVSGALTNADKSLGIDEPFVSSTDFDVLQINMTAVLALAPQGDLVTKARAALNKEFSLYVLYGKQLLAAQTSFLKASKELYGHQVQATVVLEQTQRLDSVKTDLKPKDLTKLPVDQIDLIGLCGSLSLIQTSMMGMLATTFACKNQALRYEYGQLPTLIKDFNLEGFLAAEVISSQKTLELKGKYQPFPLAPIDLVFTIPAVDLRNGGVFSTVIQMSNHAFRGYSFIRINSLVAKIEGVESPQTGRYCLEVKCDGRPFYDRDLDGNTLTYHTLPRSRDYVYNADNSPAFTDHGESWSEDSSKITPFTTWEVSLPDIPINKGIVLNKVTVTVTLSFVVQAMVTTKSNPSGVNPLVETNRSASALSAASLANRSAKGVTAKSRLLAVNPLVEAKEANTTAGIPTPFAAFTFFKAMPEASSTSKEDPLPPKEDPLPPKEDILGHMNGKSCTNGWDVVFNMKLANANEVIAQQYRDYLKNDPDYFNKVDLLPDKNLGGVQLYTKSGRLVEGWVYANSFPTENYVRSYYKFTYEAPLLNFQAGGFVDMKLPFRDGEIHRVSAYVASQEDKEKLFMLAKMSDMKKEDVKPFMKGDTQMFQLLVVDPKVTKMTAAHDIKAEGLVPIKKVKGSAETGNDDIMEVALELSEGAFSLGGGLKTIGVDLSDPQQLDFSQQLQGYFRKNPVKFVINKLKLGGKDIPRLLMPKTFYPNVVKTHSGHWILQLFIITDTSGTADPGPTQLSLQNMDDPIPIDSQASLIISNKIFTKLMVNHPFGNSNVQLGSSPPPPDQLSGLWSMTFSKMVVNPGNIDLSKLDHSGTQVGGGSAIPPPFYSYKAESSEFDLAGMQLQPGKESQLELYFNKEIPFGVVSTTTTFSIIGSRNYSRTDNYPVSLTIKAPVSMTISEKDGTQIVETVSDFNASTAEINGDMHGSGTCKSDTLQNQINENLSRQLPPLLQKVVDISFTDLATFALQNILFPSGDVIHMTSAAVPGDVIIFGDVDQK